MLREGSKPETETPKRFSFTKAQPPRQTRQEIRVTALQKQLAESGDLPLHHAMATVNLTVKHRPVRIGFVVRAGEAIDLETVSSFCALFWGGMHNPIIPVASADDALADELVRSFQVDVLFNAATNDATTRFIARYPTLRHPRLHARDLLHRDWKSKKDVSAYLDVLNAIDKYWEQDFKHAAAGTDSGCRLVTWDEADPLSLAFRLGFGTYDSGLNLLHNFEEAFVNGLRATKVAIAPDAALPADLARKTTPMRLTGADLRGSGGSFRTWAGGLYFGDFADVADLMTFWNIRAGGAAIEFVCLKALERLKPLARAHLDALDALPQRHPNIEDHIAVFFRKDQNAVLAAMRDLQVKKRLLLCEVRGGAGDVSVAEPAMFHFDWGFALGLIDRDDGAYAVTLSLPEKRFLHSARLTRRVRYLSEEGRAADGSAQQSEDRYEAVEAIRPTAANLTAALLGELGTVLGWIETQASEKTRNAILPPFKAPFAQVSARQRFGNICNTYPYQSQAERLH